MSLMINAYMPKQFVFFSSQFPYPSPGESVESVTFVNRVLPFIFADDESFEELMQLPKEPFGKVDFSRHMLRLLITIYTLKLT